MTVQNTFTMVRPQGKTEAPAKAPRKTNRSRAPIEGNVHEVLAYDRNGRRTVSLERKTKGGIVIENREQSAASVEKRKRISKGGTK